MSDKEKAIEYLQNLIKMVESGEIELIQFNLKREKEEQHFYGYTPLVPKFFTFSVLYKDNR